MDNIKKKRKLEYLLLLGLTINTIFPFDKLFILPYILFKRISGIHLSRLSKLVLFCVSLLAFESFIINYPTSNIEIFYPVFFLAGAFYLAYSDIDLLVVRNIIFINVLFGLICALLADYGIENPYSRTLMEKGMPFFFAPLGFSPTNQVFGTFCILHIIISYEYRRMDFFFYITIIACIITFNRCSMLFLLILFFIYKRKLFCGISCIIMLAVAKWVDKLEYLLSTATMESRNELRDGVKYSFWNSRDILVYLFGRGNSNISEHLANKTLWGRTYIENGIDFILHSYGFIGLIIIYIIILKFLWYILRTKKWKYLLFFSYYLLVEQWMTQEFFASSFMFFMGILLLLMKQKQKNVLCK